MPPKSHALMKRVAARVTESDENEGSSLDVEFGFVERVEREEREKSESDHESNDGDHERVKNNPDDKLSDVAKELMKLIPRYDGTGNIQKLLEFIDNFEDFAAGAQLSPSTEITVATAKLTGDAKL